jgi:hypothetical protein
VALFGDVEDRDELKPLFQIVLGIFVCERVLESRQPSPAFARILGSVEARLGESPTAFDGYAYDAKLLFLCLRILTSAGRNPHGIEEFAREIAAALDSVDEIPRRHTGEAVLLAELGLCATREPAVDKTVAEAVSDLTLLTADRAVLRDLAGRIEAATQFGLRPLEDPHGFAARAAWLLRVSSLQAFREYDLELGALLLRVVHYLRAPSRAQTQAPIEYLADQQHGDGRFGYLARELGRLGIDDRLAAARDVHLPLTVAATWTLAEATVPAFRLFGPLGAP